MAFLFLSKGNKYFYMSRYISDESIQLLQISLQPT